MIDNTRILALNFALWGTIQLIAACAQNTSAEESSTIATNCLAGQSRSCICSTGTAGAMTGSVGTQTCSATLQYGACQCNQTSSQAGVGGGAAGSQPTTAPGTSGSNAAASGKGGSPMSSAGSSSVARGGSGGRVNTTSTTAGAGGKKTGAAGAAGAAGTGSVTTATDDLDEVRQVCVDKINEFRATLSLTPLKRASAETEACSDKGAEQDGIANQAHGSAGNCSSRKLPGSGLMGGQDTCPGWPVGGWGGGSTLGETLVKCLQQMWDEKIGYDQVGTTRQACQQDYANCFLKYGHYLNMSDTSYTTVSCGFYNMGNNTWWMNQDF
jgi:hypothetical protein